MAFPLSVLKLKKSQNLRIIEEVDKKKYGKNPLAIFNLEIENMRKAGIIVDENYEKFLMSNIRYFFRNSVPVIVITLKLKYDISYKSSEEYKILVQYIARDKLSTVEFNKFISILDIQIGIYASKISKLRV